MGLTFPFGTSQSPPMVAEVVIYELDTGSMEDSVSFHRFQQGQGLQD